MNKIILIQRNVRKFLEKLKPNIKSTKKTFLPKNENENENNPINSINNNMNSINQNENFSYDNKPNNYNNNNYIFDNNDNKPKSSEEELREKFNQPNKNYENISNKTPKNNFNNNNMPYNNSNLDCSSRESNKNPLSNKNLNLNNLPLKNGDNKKNNFDDSLKTISLNNEPLDSNKINDSSVNNSLLYMNSFTSVNNNIKQYLNNNNTSNYNSFADNSRSITINEDNNPLRNTNRGQDTTSSKKRENSDSLRTIQYKYNKSAYNDFIKYILKDNYINYAINQLKKLGNYIKYYKLIYIINMLEQRIVKVMQQFAFFIIKGEGFVIKKNIFFNILRKYLEHRDIYINDNNDISNLLKSMTYYYDVYKNNDYIPYIKPNDEKKLVHTQLFNKDINFNNLISFIMNYLKFEKKVNELSPELIKYYLIKRPLKNYNIFTITRYINSLNYIIIFNSYNAKNLLNKDKNYRTYNNIPKNYILKSNNVPQSYNEPHKRCLSLGDNKLSNLKKINTIYAMKKKIGLNRDSTCSNIMKKKFNDNIINREIVNQIYEDYNNNKKYMKRRSVNYEKADDFKIGRHVSKNSSCNVNDIFLGNLKKPNNSLVKKRFSYIKMKNNN